ncbi:MAG TPA: hypothetical protein VJ253_06780, partial [Dehalococcoidia bacterium]|nr:hypothetical protein [Dehalococcoidia bacterium]
MSDRDRFDRLDESLDGVAETGRATPTGDDEVDRLARFAPDLTDLPDPAFKERLRAELFPRGSLLHRLRLWLTESRRPQLLAGSLSLAALVGVVAVSYIAAAGPPPASAEVDGYVALVPRVLRAGETESVSLSLFDGDRLARGDVQVAFRRENETILQTSAHIKGKGTLQLQVPQDARGDYEIVVNGPGFTDTARVQVQQGTLL